MRPLPPPPDDALIATGKPISSATREHVLDALGRLGRAGDDRDARRAHPLARRDLRAHRLDRVGRRADPGEPGVVDRPREVGVLGEEAVAGMDRLCARALRDLDDAVAAQVALGRRPRPEQVGLVRDGDVQLVAIGLGVDGDGRDPELAERAEDADRDLAAIGDEHLRERLHASAYSPGR